MTEFGSDAWLAMLAERLTTRDAPESQPLTVGFRIDGAEGESVRCFHLVLGDGDDRAVTGNAPGSAVVFSLSEATAQRIAMAELSPEEAFLAGDLRLSGDPQPLIAAHRAADDA